MEREGLDGTVPPGCPTCRFLYGYKYECIQEIIDCVQANQPHARFIVGVSGKDDFYTSSRHLWIAIPHERGFSSN